jgi:chromosome segregation ATPase
MPRNKGRRGEANGDWEAGGTEESYVNGSDGNSSSNRAGANGGGENGDNIDNDRMNNNLSGGRRRQTRGGDSSQHRPKHGLGPWTEAVSETVRSMGAAHQAIKDLQGRFESHVDDLRTMEETKETLRQLKGECREKDEEIQRHAATITTLSSMNRKTEEMSKHQKEKIEQERQELEQEKAKLEKRVTTAIAEERHKLRKEFDKLVIEHGQSYDKRKKELEDEFAAQREENNRRVTALEAENGQLSTTVEKQEATVENQAKKLEKTIEQCDVLERAKDSIKRELLDREMELDMLKREFALSPKSKEYLYVF